MPAGSSRRRARVKSFQLPTPNSSIANRQLLFSPELQGLREVLRKDGLAAVEIGNRARHAQQPIEAPRRDRELLQRALEQLPATRVDRRAGAERASLELRVQDPVARLLTIARGDDPLADRRSALSG